ncbi:MAG: imidazole glycerol phosphate synthase subunit HisH [Bryobacteraceae bacterium]
MISILDYGAGNLRSVENTLGAIGAEYELIRTAEQLRTATKVILPGVGHFGQMMRALDSMNVRTALLDTMRAGVPFLGICLGLQALFQASEEAPEVKGFGIFEGTVRRFQGDMRIPHMGWNEVDPVRRERSRLLRDIDKPPYLYFANSYYCPVIPATTGICHYGVEFTAILEHDNICGVQFHPEKSGDLGLKIVRNFVEEVA